MPKLAAGMGLSSTSLTTPEVALERRQHRSTHLLAQTTTSHQCALANRPGWTAGVQCGCSIWNLRGGNGAAATAPGWVVLGRGAFWGGLQGWLFGGVFLFVRALGCLVTAVVAAIEGTVVSGVFLRTSN